MAKTSQNLSDRLERRIGQKTDKGTLITQEVVDSARAIESDLLIIRENNAELIANTLIPQAIAKSLEEIGLAAERFAKLDTPVDTGRLRNSITHVIDMSDTSVYVGTNVEYAPYVELGVHGRKGRQMLTKAAQDHEDFYRRIAIKHMGGK